MTCWLEVAYHVHCAVSDGRVEGKPVPLEARRQQKRTDYEWNELPGGYLQNRCWCPGLGRCGRLPGGRIHLLLAFRLEVQEGRLEMEFLFCMVLSAAVLVGVKVKAEKDVRRDLR